MTNNFFESTVDQTKSSMDNDIDVMPGRINLDKTEITENVYKDQRIQIKKFVCDNGELHHYCGYVIVNKDVITKGYTPPVSRSKGCAIETAGYYSKEFYDLVYGIDVHGGITYFEDAKEAIVFGWDYGHFGDDEIDYTRDDIIKDAQNVTDQLIELLGIEK